jgi:hypothetical protein
LAAKLRVKIAEHEQRIRNFEFARQRMSATRQAANGNTEVDRLDRALALNQQSLDSLYRELAAAQEKLALYSD